MSYAFFSFFPTSYDAIVVKLPPQLIKYFSQVQWESGQNSHFSRVAERKSATWHSAKCHSVRALPYYQQYIVFAIVALNTQTQPQTVVIVVVISWTGDSRHSIESDSESESGIALVQNC